MAIRNGNTVKVHYKGTLSDGTEFDSSLGREPLEFEMGKGLLIPGFEAALIGKEKGDSLTVTIPAAEAYGEHLEDLIMVVPRDQIPGDITPEVGLVLQCAVEDGEMDVLITDVSDDEVHLDANHPLAGEDLTFAIEVVDVAAR